MAVSRRDFIISGMATAAASAAAQTTTAAAPQTPAKLMPPDRMPDMSPEKMTEAQKKAAADFQAGRNVPVFGPFVPLLRSPEVMLRAMSMGDYLRYKTVLPAALNEFVILITARQWTQEYEWAVHHPIALKAGLKPEIAQAVAEGRRPQSMSADEELVYDFCIELHRNQSVCDQTYQRALARFGEQGVIDLIGVNGYYVFLAMVLNTARTALPKNAAPALAAFPH
jgi:4-carboxymuconolactone decarboxylase